MLVRCMIDDKFRNHFQFSLVCFIEKFLEVIHCSITGIDTVIICNIITIIPQGRWIKREYPYCCYSEFLEIIQFFHETLEIANTIFVTVTKGFYVEFINNSVFIPELLICHSVFIIRHEKDLRKSLSGTTAQNCIL